MRTHKLCIALLGLLLLGSFSIQAGDPKDDPNKATEASSAETLEDTSEETDKKPKKEKTTNIEEEKDILVLHINNFDRALSENEFLLVEFYAPWCGHCKEFEPIYAEVAEKLKEEEAGIRLAKVDAIEEKELADEFEVGSFPTLKVFINGDRKQPLDYTGKRSVVGIIQWMKRRAGPGTSNLDFVDSAVKFISTHNISVVGFFNSLESESAKVFKEVAFDLTDVEFGVTATPEVFQKYEVKSDSVVLFKKFDDGREDYVWSEEEKLDKHNLTSFIKENSLELIIPFNTEVADKIFASRIRLHSLLFINSTVQSQLELVEQAKAVAKEFKGKMLFVLIDVTQALSHVLNYFGVSESDAPTARIIHMETQKKFSIPSGALTADSLWLLCQEVVDGIAMPYYRSEEIPEEWDKEPVKVLVGKNFKSVALDPAKNVFIEFYAPWCGHCKELAPIWDQLGEKYADHENIIIAKMDATANEVESLVISGFPTIKYYPAEGKEVETLSSPQRCRSHTKYQPFHFAPFTQVVDYTGNRDLETFSKFLDNGGVLPQEENGEDDDYYDDGEESSDAKEEDSSGDQSKEVDESAEISENKTSKDEL
ncbi:PREDICTED: protein disulfide-isomerase-like isoform X1 [Poecilia mexicana]|uniref:protein disulfide-isomerase-like isoform X1 n=1 Tax=Poecilia mexicana TaxID=48701 RepID=UPI00072DA093|nr:PREDICTED: protein disulfide-isomerase-like isoform X1 [Poecilia mexicana]